MVAGNGTSTPRRKIMLATRPPSAPASAIASHSATFRCPAIAQTARKRPLEPLGRPRPYWPVVAIEARPRSGHVTVQAAPMRLVTGRAYSCAAACCIATLERTIDDGRRAAGAGRGPRLRGHGPGDARPDQLTPSAGSGHYWTIDGNLHHGHDEPPEPAVVRGPRRPTRPQPGRALDHVPRRVRGPGPPA